MTSFLIPVNPFLGFLNNLFKQKLDDYGTTNE